MDRQRLMHCLRDVARQRATITYVELARCAHVPPPHTIHRVTEALEDLLREDWAHDRPALASLAVSRARNGLPGRGYFQLARRLGRYRGGEDGPEAEAFHRGEVERVWATCGGTP